MLIKGCIRISKIKDKVNFLFLHFFVYLFKKNYLSTKCSALDVMEKRICIKPTWPKDTFYNFFCHNKVLQINALWCFKSCKNEQNTNQNCLEVFSFSFGLKA